LFPSSTLDGIDSGSIGLGLSQVNLKPENIAGGKLERLRRRKSLDIEALAHFRNDVLQLYTKFEQDLAAISLKYGFEINMWYSPSRIPQPNFKAGNVLLDVDQLYDDGEFKQIIGQQLSQNTATNGPVSKLGSTAEKLDGYIRPTSINAKDVKHRPRGLQTLLDGGTALDFRRGEMDLRRKRKKSRPLPILKSQTRPKALLL